TAPVVETAEGAEGMEPAEGTRDADVVGHGVAPAAASVVVPAPTGSGVGCRAAASRRVTWAPPAGARGAESGRLRGGAYSRPSPGFSAVAANTRPGRVAVPRNENHPEAGAVAPVTIQDSPSCATSSPPSRCSRRSPRARPRPC